MILFFILTGCDVEFLLVMPAKIGTKVAVQKLTAETSLSLRSKFGMAPRKRCLNSDMLKTFHV